MNKQAYLEARRRASELQRKLLPEIQQANAETEKAVSDLLAYKRPASSGLAEGLRQAALAGAKSRLKASLDKSDKVARPILEARCAAIEAAGVEGATKLATEVRGILASAPNYYNNNELMIMQNLIEIAEQIIKLAFQEQAEG